MSTVADRIKLHRARRAAGRFVVFLEVNEGDVESLEQARLFESPQGDRSREDVACAIRKLLSALGETNANHR